MNKFKKQIISLILCFLTTFFVACGKSNSTSSNISLSQSSSKSISSSLQTSMEETSQSITTSTSNSNQTSYKSNSSTTSQTTSTPSLSSSNSSSSSFANSSVISSSVTSSSSSSSITSSSTSSSEGGSSSQTPDNPLDVSEYIVSTNNIPLKLQYDEPAPILPTENCSTNKASTDIGSTADDSWEEWSLPIGNGYFGANVFGRTETERIQISEKTLSNPNQYIDDNSYGGLNNFSETYIDFNHTTTNVSNYKRFLDLKTAIAGVNYTYDGINYSREYFTSYPDKVLVIKLDASGNGNLNFTLRPTIPYEQDYLWAVGDGLTKHGTVTSSVKNGVGEIELSGKLGYYDVDFLGLYKVYTNGGSVTASTTQHTYTDTAGLSHTDTDGTIVVQNATSAYIVVTLGTDYQLTSDIFTSDDNLNNCLRNEYMDPYTTVKPTYNTTLDDTRVKVQGETSKIQALLADKSFEEGYTALKDRHVQDHSSLFESNTVDFNCNPADFELTTDDLLNRYKNNLSSSYLELLLYQYGRYMLIASSRPGTLPAHLQGVWNTYNNPAWSCNYTHNINVQMNYWPAFTTNLAETFEAYLSYNEAYIEAAEKWADLAVIWQGFSDKYDDDGGNGWVVGHFANPYTVTYDASPGNLGFTTQLLWEYYQYTQDKEKLEEFIYPALYSAAQFITKMVVQDEDGHYLVAKCDSPEQYVNGQWYYTQGTTYAQSFSYQNNYNLLLAAKELGIDLKDNEILSKQENAVLKTVLQQIDKYDPILVGLSGQVKEFREEGYYGELGEWKHRHIAQLVGIFPGNVINSTTPAWIDAAKVALTERGVDSGVGWSAADKLCMWARTKDGDTAHYIIENLLKSCIVSNLWDVHMATSKNVFQIDGNFGATAGIAELLLQSDAGYIEPLAALPSAWSTGSYNGLVARGNFEVSASWENGLAKSINILSRSGGRVAISYPSITGATVRTIDGDLVDYTIDGNHLISFETEVGESYVIYGFKSLITPSQVQDFEYTRMDFEAFNFTWSSVQNATKYNIYLAVENQPDYTLIGTTTNTYFSYLPEAKNLNARMTFVVIAVSSDLVESKRTLCYYNPIQIIDGITIDEVKEASYGNRTEIALLDGDRSYNISAVKTQSGVFIYSQGIFNTSVDNTTNSDWTTKTNFEFRLNGGKQSYVNIIKQSSGVTHFTYNVEQLANGKYLHTVEIFVAKDLIQNWSDNQDVQINYAWKTPTENAYIISDMIDYRHIDWNMDWHSCHRLGGLETSFVPLQANLFVSTIGLVSASAESVDGVISNNEYTGTSISANTNKTNVEVKGKVSNGDIYLAFTITHGDWSAYDNRAGWWPENDNIELYVNGQKIIVLFINGELVLPTYVTYGKMITTTASDNKLVSVVELYIQGNSSTYDLKIGMNGKGFGWVGVMWQEGITNVGVLSASGITRNS